MGDYDDLPYIVIERRSGAVAPFLWGALVGAGLALLLAPRSGEETQQELRDSVRRIRLATEERINDARDAVVGAVDQARESVQERIDAVRDAVQTGTEQARHAVDAGRQAARETRSDLERRVSEAKSALQADALESEDMGMEPPAPVEVDVVVTEVVIEKEPPRPPLG